MEEYAKHLLDGCYLLFEEFLQKKKHLLLKLSSHILSICLTAFFSLSNFQETKF